MKNAVIGVLAVVTLIMAGVWAVKFFPWNLILVLIGGGLIGWLIAGANDNETL